MLREPDAVADDLSAPEPDATPELAAAWQALSLHWLNEYPAYREVIKRRVSEARRRRAALEDRIKLPSLDLDPTDFDHLGREVEGCG